MNPRTRNANRGPAEWIDAAAAARMLDVKRETLYSYASRGLVRSAAAGGATRARVYHRDDVERLRARSVARSGHGAVAAGALRWGEPVLETSVGSVGPRGPIYRGKIAVDLARDGARFEDVASLLWDAPFPRDYAAVDARGGRGFSIPPARLRAVLRNQPEPFDGMLAGAAAFAAREPRGETLDAARANAPNVVRKLVATMGLARSADASRAALEASGVARSALVALGARTTASAVLAMDEALVLVADHELNASTFAARVAASAGATISSCVVAALAVLSGPLHGAMTARVEAFAAEVGRPDDAASAVAARLDRGEAVPGFGHPLYPDGDPRGARLLEAAVRLAPRAPGVRVIASIASAMDLVARERPTLDLGLVALSCALGLPRGAAMAIFASGRSAGWIAHALEQRRAGFLLRPRARYVGSLPDAP